MATASAVAALRSSAAATALYHRCFADPVTRGAPLRNFIRHLPFCSQRCDIIHFEFLGTAGMYPLAAELTGVPTIVSCRGSDIHLFDLRDAEVRAGMVTSLHQAAAVHCVSDEVAGHVRRVAGPDTRIWVNRPAVDTGTIRARTWDSSSRRPLRIVSVGRLTWHKGFDYLLAAFAQLARRGVDFTATVLGDGELLAPLRFSVTDLGLEGRVEIPGAVAPSQVLESLQHADVFVLASHDEGISNAALEAMASGLPVVSTRVGGMPEAIEDGIEGFLVPARDIDALATAIERLAEDRALCSTMGFAARRKAEAEFSLERQVRSFEQLYRSVLEDRN